MQKGGYNLPLGEAQEDKRQVVQEMPASRQCYHQLEAYGHQSQAQLVLLSLLQSCPTQNHYLRSNRPSIKS